MPIANGMVAWWAAEGDANDQLGGNNGSLQNGTTFASGEVGQAFSFDGADDYVSIPASPSLNVGTNSGLTFELWIQPSSLPDGSCIMEYNNGAGAQGVHFWHSLYQLGGAGSLFANIVDSGGNIHLLYSASGYVNTSSFQHVALTYKKATGVAKLFYNGSMVASNYVGVFTPSTTYNLIFGRRISGGLSGQYAGLMDEIGVYNRGLEDSEILAIFSAGMSGKCTNSPPLITAQPSNQSVSPGTNANFAVTAMGVGLQYQWRLNAVDILGATNRTLSLTNVQPAAAGTYSVAVSNGFGNVISSNALLKVNVVFGFGNGQPLTNSQASFSGQVTVQLQNAYSNGPIFYTIDGSTPSIFSEQYTVPFVMTHDFVLRAVGYSPNFFQSGELDAVSVFIVPNYKLVATNTPGGTVAISPPGGTYLSNTTVTVTATPASGWMFLQWLGDATGTNGTTAVTMNRAKYAQAAFGTTLSTTVAGNGALTLNPPGGVYPYGTIVSLSAIPQPGNAFGLWGNAASGNVNPLYFGITNPNPTISSVFGAVGSGQVSFTVVPVGNGRVTVNPRANIYSLHQNISITAVSDSNQTFLGWSGDATGAQNPLVITLNQNTVIFANFTHRAALSTSASYEGLKGEGFVFTLRGDFDGRYEIDESSNLLNWTSLGSVTSSYGTLQFLDSQATNFSRNFYRSVPVP